LVARDRRRFPSSREPAARTGERRRGCDRSPGAEVRVNRVISTYRALLGLAVPRRRSTSLSASQSPVRAHCLGQVQEAVVAGWTGGQKRKQVSRLARTHARTHARTQDTRDRRARITIIVDRIDGRPVRRTILRYCARAVATITAEELVRLLRSTSGDRPAPAPVPRPRLHSSTPSPRSRPVSRRRRCRRRCRCRPYSPPALTPSAATEHPRILGH
jgi:hypothetical protein